MVGRIGKQWRGCAVKWDMKMDAPFRAIWTRDVGFILRWFASQRVVQIQVNRFVSIGLAHDHLVKVNTVIECSQCLARFSSRNQFQREAKVNFAELDSV